jgi:hypothetical protein
MALCSAVQQTPNPQWRSIAMSDGTDTIDIDGIGIKISSETADADGTSRGKTKAAGGSTEAPEGPYGVIEVRKVAINHNGTKTK